MRRKKGDQTSLAPFPFFPLYLGAVLAVPAHAHKDQLLFAQLLGPQTERLEHPGPEILDDHICPRCRESPRDGATLLRPEVRGDAAAVPPVRAPPQRRARRVQHPERPQGVPSSPRGLDLDDVGPEISEQGPGEVPSDDLPEVEDFHSRERAWMLLLLWFVRGRRGGEESRR